MVTIRIPSNYESLWPKSLSCRW